MSSFFNTSYLADILVPLFDRRSEPQGKAPDTGFPELVTTLFAAQSETQQNRTSRAILLKYHQGTMEDRIGFFTYLAGELDVDAASIADAAAAYSADPSAANYAALGKASEAQRIRLFRLLANVRGGAKCLVKIREHVRLAMRDDPSLGPLEQDLKRMLVAWFNRGFLVMRPITWQTSAQVLEKIIAYEAVHQISDWNDLRRRLHPNDRRCYAFFHPRMPDDPIIFVEVALTATIPNAITTLLAEDREEPDFNELDTAVFYSISNCHAGLAGISFGNALIKQVARDLAMELPQLRKFVTLSPIPGLSKWAETTPEDDDETRVMAAKYLVEAKRPDGSPLDPVANFHLGNGAELHAVHAGANPSPGGQKQSFGAMVNYLYDLPQVEARSEGFATDKTVTTSPQVQTILRPARRQKRVKK